jgi:hypothetical protein
MFILNTCGLSSRFDCISTIYSFIFKPRINSSFYEEDHSVMVYTESIYLAHECICFYVFKFRQIQNKFHKTVSIERCVLCKVHYFDCLVYGGSGYL